MRHACSIVVILALSMLSGALWTKPSQAIAARETITCHLLNERGQPIYPNNAISAGGDLYLLGSQNLWRVPAAAGRLNQGKPLFAINMGPTSPNIGKVPIQEFSTFAYMPDRQSLAVLDKAGDIYEYSLAKMNWSVLRPNTPFGSPDPEYLDMVSAGKNVCLLDPERNQIWRFPATNQRYFKEVLPWRLHPGQISVADAVAIAHDGTTWIIRRAGNIARFQAADDAGLAHQLRFRWQAPKGMRPCRLFTQKDMPLYAVERENNRVIAIDKQTGAYQQFLFEPGSDLRGMVPEKDGFWIIDRDRLVYRSLAHPNAADLNCSERLLDKRLHALTMPLKGASLPAHPGVWAGARRLYRHGVHKGTDFFHDPGRGTMIAMGTPALAAGAGKILRADANFRDMDATTYHRVIQECHQTHHSSERNEDLLRGCQVWIDHGGGLITKYAHLDKIKAGLKPGMKVAQGDVVGFVGVSGTGQNLPGRSKHPHLHFEVWLDNAYVGQGFTPSETIGVYEDIFGSLNRKR